MTNSTPPAFIRKDPPMTTSAAPQVSSPLLARNPVEAATQLGESVARLINERDNLIEDLRLVRLHNETLIAQLTQAETDRDRLAAKATFFERFSMTVVANFNTIRMIVDETQRKANDLAHQREPAPKPEGVPNTAPDHVADLERSLANLQQNGDQK